MKTFAIHESNLDRLYKKINRIRTKCQKYGCDFYYSEVGEDFRQIEDKYGKHTERFVLVECEGTAVVNGWRFVATLHHTQSGNIVRSLVDSVEIPQRYYTCEPRCEHCNFNRHRKDTYIVYNEDTKEFKQVGSSCLCDFTHGLSAEAAAAYIALFDTLIEYEAPEKGYTPNTYMSVKDILKYAVGIVKDYGYIPTSYESCGQLSTRYQVHIQWVYDHYRKDLLLSDIRLVEEFRNNFGDNFDIYEDTATRIIEFFKHADESSSYIHNLKVIANSEYVEFSSLGYAVSMVPTFTRHVKTEEQKVLRQESKFVGQVNDKITVHPSDIKVVTTFENFYGYYRSLTTRYKITGDDGNIYMWDTSSYIDHNKEVASIVGTVKKHDEFNGVKQTWLTRCKVTYQASI